MNGGPRSDLRLGSVPYLNARPLVEGLDPVRFEVPGRLARLLAGGELDAALVPVLAVLERDGYRLVDGVAIACRGPVRSVIVAPWPAAVVAPDPDSRTSNELARLLLPPGVRWEDPAGPGIRARVRIGDPALAWRDAHPAEPVLDLGAAWVESRGLPFVFAVWAVAPGVPPAAAAALAARLRSARTAGRAALSRIAPAPDALAYLQHHVVHDLGPDEKAGLERFQQELLDAGRLSHKSGLVWI